MKHRSQDRGFTPVFALVDHPAWTSADLPTKFTIASVFGATKIQGGVSILQRRLFRDIRPRAEVADFVEFIVASVTDTGRTVAYTSTATRRLSDTSDAALNQCVHFMRDEVLGAEFMVAKAEVIADQLVVAIAVLRDGWPDVVPSWDSLRSEPGMFRNVREELQG